MPLKPEVIKTIRDRKDLIKGLQSEMNWSYDMTARYLRNNTDQLLNIKALTLISRKLQIPVKSLYQ